MKTILISPDQIKWHHLIQDMPCWTTASPEMSALVEDIQERGIDQPLIVCETEGCEGADDTYYLLDGRHRHRGAQAAGLDKVPVIVRPEEDAVGIIFSSITQRRHFGKGALAYLLYPVMCADAMSHGGDRRSKSTQSTLKKKPALESTLILDLCVRAGFSRDLYFQAKSLHQAFGKRPDLREEYEPRILAGEIGLGACLAGLAGKEATHGGNRNDRPPEQLVFDTFTDLRNRFSRWEKIEPTHRKAICHEAADTVLALPHEVQESILKALRASRKTAA
jgi:ParB-like nuclease domain